MWENQVKIKVLTPSRVGSNFQIDTYVDQYVHESSLILVFLASRMFSNLLYKVLYFVTDEDRMTKSLKVFACCVILYNLLSFADFFQTDFSF